MNKLNINEIKSLTYDGEILESDGRLSGYIIVNNIKTHKIWVPIDDKFYTDDLDFCDKWQAKKNNITVEELKSIRLKNKERINNYSIKK